ncbi:WD40/YVTN/BNR-like repeat-containing protein [Pseudogracilibacillus sp. SO30301A]|uniref:WD40/YVTN/BNR-like repeat-containing protein n=1 Tax=Pseudogracilibacillus sp. SO30301A TaxID=3098291 RepID=UPI00300E4E1E
MKKVILALSIIMMIGLSIGIYVNERQGKITFPYVSELNDSQQNTVDELEPSREETLQPVNSNTIDYSLQNDALHITYNQGNDWVKVPVEKEILFAGEYSGNKQELIDGSYVLIEDRAAFLYADGDRIVMKHSTNQGETWDDSLIAQPFPPIRFRKLDFLNDQFGYAIISGDRTMSQEYSAVFLTHDGGTSWEQTNDSGNTRLISDGGFVNETTGFLSYGTINPEEPDFYVTKDGGNTWNQAVLNIPEKYHKIFVTAEVPTTEGEHLAVLVNQGPNGDYKGGNVKGKFISEDNGKTWDFLMEVQPSEEE